MALLLVPSLLVTCEVFDVQIVCWNFVLQNSRVSDNGNLWSFGITASAALSFFARRRQNGAVRTAWCVDSLTWPWMINNWDTFISSMASWKIPELNGGFVRWENDWYMLHIQWWTVQQAILDDTAEFDQFLGATEYFSETTMICNGAMYRMEEKSTLLKIAWQLHVTSWNCLLVHEWLRSCCLWILACQNSIAGTQQKSVRRLRTSARSPGGPQGPG